MMNDHTEIKNVNKSLQTTKPLFTTIVLGPGGIKGYLHLGALFVLHQHHYLDKVDTYIGVSIGAIISLLLICGYTPGEITNRSMEIDLFSQLSIEWSNITEKNGILSNELLRKALKQLIEAKLKCIPSLSELYKLTGKKLITVTNNLSKRDGAEYMSYENEPSLSCLDAVMFSANIPFIFLKLVYRGNIYIDGASVNPYPVDIVDPSIATLGIYIDNDDEKEVANSAKAYLSRVFESPLREIYRRNRLASSDKCYHLRLICDVHDSIGLSITIDKKGEMLMKGYFEMIKFLIS